MFDLFTSSPFIYQKLTRGGVYGVRVVESTQCNGIVKVREGMTGDVVENPDTDATIHIKPMDARKFGDMVGNGVVIDGRSYDITGMVEGKDFDTGVVEFYRLTLKRANRAEA